MDLAAETNSADGRTNGFRVLAASVPTATKPTAAVLSRKPGHESRCRFPTARKDGFSPCNQDMNQDMVPTRTQGMVRLPPINYDQYQKTAESVRVPERRQFTVFAGGVNVAGSQPS